MGTIPTASVQAPATALADGRQLLDVDVDKLAGALSLVAADACAGAVTAIQPPNTLGGHDRLDGGGGKANLVGDMGCAEAMVGSEIEYQWSVADVTAD